MTMTAFEREYTRRRIDRARRQLVEQHGRPHGEGKSKPDPDSPGRLPVAALTPYERAYAACPACQYDGACDAHAA